MEAGEEFSQLCFKRKKLTEVLHIRVKLEILHVILFRLSSTKFEELKQMAR